MDYTINNPYRTESINYLEIWLTNSSPGIHAHYHPDAVLIYPLTTNSCPSFHLMIPIPKYQGYIGRYAGRAEDSYQPRERKNGVFVFVLSGVFEVQNRLLHQRDGLSLTNVQNGEVDFEALSNDAVLLLLEVPQ